MYTIITHIELEYAIQAHAELSEAQAKRMVREFGLPAKGIGIYCEDKGDYVTAPIGTIVNKYGKITWTIEDKFKVSEHTKGEWRVVETQYPQSSNTPTHTGFNIWASGKELGPKGKPICNVTLHNAVGVSESERRANAELIAAAPDLLSAVKYSFHCLNDLEQEMGQIGDAGDQARQALKQAIDQIKIKK